MTQGKSRMRQFRTSGSVRRVAREGDSYRDTPVLNEVKDLSLFFLIDPSKLRMRETRTLNLEH